jgi:hypothetical protein
MVAIAGAPACLELNPTYVDDDASTGEVESSSSTIVPGSESSAGASSSSSGEPVDCSPDMFDPNSFDEPADMGSTNIPGLRLEGVDDEDWYKSFLEPTMPTEVFARTGTGEVRVCFFPECDGGASSDITKCSDEASESPGGLKGCCSPDAVGLEYDCGGSLPITVHVRVDGGGDRCPVYDLEIGFQGQ